VNTAAHHPKEWKLVSLRECPTPEEMQFCDKPEQAAEYWNAHVSSHPYFNPDCECFVVLILNARRKIKGHHLVSIGTLDSIQISPREVFRVAILAAASAIVLMHNHPSGDATPSEADIRATRELIRAGQILNINVCDHVIVGNKQHVSLRTLGYFYS
jgi:DNA repair protein RadC